MRKGIIFFVFINLFICIFAVGLGAESGCSLAAELLEALLETKPFAWTVSKKKQCAAFRAPDKGG